MTVASAVLDASVLVRASVEKTDSARQWVEAIDQGRTRGFATDLVWLEVASALRGYVVAGAMTREKAFAVLDDLRALRVEAHPLESLVAPALDVALELGLSVYDASYVALAEAADAVLVTADRRLAAAVARSQHVD